VVTVYFVDSSALAKRYLVETGTSWVISWIEPAAGNIILVSELALVEMQSLLTRRMREGSITSAAAMMLKNDFSLHYQDEYLVILADTPIYQAAGQMVSNHRLRTLDAIQLASALHAFKVLGDPITFISADLNLLTAAAAEGFSTDDPNLYP
jgi:predicted nucleic acid-binding protein